MTGPEWLRPRRLPPAIPAGVAGDPARANEPPVLEQTDWLESLRTPQGREPGIASVDEPLRRSASPGPPGANRKT